MPKLSETLKNLLPGSDVKALLGSLERIATALEVMAGLRLRTEQGKDESEVMESNDEEYARREQEEIDKGRPEEED
ncbi:hypothetical protein LCGC14_1388360 [marine sediment metagenome]|uniref:Uncharacterized protein n=1 Tax=marine sediment metagenome TaxID=412755 RepID=A0A0F9K0U9_9ZZZZ